MAPKKLEWRQEGNVKHAAAADGVYSVRIRVPDAGPPVFTLVHTAKADGAKTGIGADYPTQGAAMDMAQALAFPAR
ncbi:hypothetical protein [Reyranella sp.]|uniref:hypothetical protein n=1 Tax=Reyranella sp. TaxID=1929291 RepID=UPI003F70FE81